MSKYGINCKGVIAMNIVTKLLGVDSIVISRVFDEDGDKEVSIVIEASQNSNSLKKMGREPILTQTSIEPNSMIRICDVEIESVGYSDGAMLINFPKDTDIVIVDTGEFQDVDPDSAPSHIYEIADAEEYEQPLHTNS